MSAIRTLAARVLLGSFEGLTLPPWARNQLAAGLGGICLYGDNVASLDQIRDLNAAVHDAAPGAITSLDEEGGDVTRLFYLEGSPHAGHAALGAVDDEALTTAVAADIGDLLLRHGVDLDLGPVADVNSAADNPVIGVRSFGAQPEVVARHVTAWVRGLQSAGTGACLKHFPGHGDTTVDSHLDLPSVEQPLDVLDSRELVPFRAGAKAGAVAVMTSHVLIPALDRDWPATLSAAATRLLRDSVGFDGLLVSDALDMKGASAGRGIPAAAVLALAAGVDMLCIGPSFTDEGIVAVIDAIETAVADGALPPERLVDAAARVDAASARLARLRANAVSPTSTPEISPDASTEAAERAITIRRPFESMAGAQVLRLVTGSNLAVGHVPWGLPTDGRVVAGRPVAQVHEGDRPWEQLTAEPVVVLVRDPGRLRWVRETVNELVRRRPDTVVVELGWPSEQVDATVWTWGASAVSARALDEVLSAGSSTGKSLTGQSSVHGYPR